ncbi:E3 ubiquitin-protein ligase Pep5p [Trichomonascus vanleenenianus]|uniref:tethering complex subunit PEP5 n=1 Tax=Trichomonascus vanleenenianus TaxID=2268995 RepID=UPI003ECB66EF
MSLASWRVFNFFDLTAIRDPASTSETPLFSDSKLTEIRQGRNGSVFFGTNDGVVKEFTQDMELRQQFAAYDDSWSITQLKYLEGTSLLLTIGEKQGEPLKLHLWDLEKFSKGTTTPHCHTTVNITNGRNTFPLSAFAISSDYSILGCGYADGTVIIVRGDIVHDRGSRQRVVYNSQSPITGLGFYEKGDNITLFVTSVSQVFTVPTHGRNPGKEESTLDKSRGAALGCVAQDSNQKLIVAQDSGITYYTSRLRDVSFVFDVPKKSIFPFRQYLVISTAGSLTGTSSNSALSSLVDSSTSRIIIIDTENKYIAYNGQISNGLKGIFVQWGQLNILGSDGVLYAVKEKSLTARLDILKQRHLYDFAIHLAKEQNADDKTILDIESEFGDFLYNEGEVNESLVHYINAISPSVQSSRVILKYRDSQYISNLTAYLEALHDRGYATKEHTTLLLNSYAKLKNIEQLTKFVEAGAEEGKFDFDTAIKICRQAGYYPLATYLAQRNGDSDTAVLIMLRDLHDSKSCLKYIQTLDFNNALTTLITHSRLLLDEHPVETTALLITMFTGKYVPKPLELSLPSVNGSLNGSGLTSDQNSIAAPVLQSYRAFVNYMASGFGGMNGNAESLTPGTPSEPTYQPPKPRLIFSSFIDHPNEFVIFLEACLESYDRFEGDEKNRVDLVSTLFEMYLTLANKAQSDDEKREWQQKAKALGLDKNNKMDQNTMLLLTHMTGFHDNELMAAAYRDGFQVDMFRSCVASRDVQGAIEVLHKYGDQQKELYPLALNFFTSSTQVLEEAGEEEFNFVLTKIKEKRLMAPLQIIHELSTNSVVKVGQVRKFLLDLIASENTEIEHNTRLAQSYQEETAQKAKEINSLMNDPMVIQYSVCASCNLPLDLPAEHFVCRHSYHQRCLANSVAGSSINELNYMHAEGSTKCPKCSSDVETIRALRDAQEEAAQRSDLFEAALKDSEHKYKVVADFFGRGALTNV